MRHTMHRNLIEMWCRRNYPIDRIDWRKLQINIWQDYSREYHCFIILDRIFTDHYEFSRNREDC